MTDKQFLSCVQELPNYQIREDYISDLALSDIWGDDDTADIPQSRIDAIGQIYDAVNRDVRSIANLAHLSHRKLAERFLIPYRTVENWCSGVCSCPLYTRLMMQECLGLLKR